MKLPKYPIDYAPYHRGHMLLWMGFMLVFIASFLQMYFGFLGIVLIPDANKVFSFQCFLYGGLSLLLLKKVYVYGTNKWFFKEIDDMSNNITGAYSSFELPDENYEFEVHRLLTLIAQSSTDAAVRKQSRDKLRKIIQSPYVSEDLKEAVKDKHPYLS